MKIAHVSPYDHQVSGGVREHVVNLARHHRGLGHDVTVMAPASRPEVLDPDVVCASTTVVALPGAGSIARISLSPAVFPRMARFLDRGQFDVVHIHEPLLPMVSFAALYHARTVTVGTIHGYRPKLLFYRLANRPLRRMMNRLSARVAVSTDAEQWARQYFPGTYHIIPDGVDVERFSDPDVKPVARFDDGRPNILFVGRLEPRKGFRYLLDAFGAVQRAVPDARLVVAGHYSESDRARWSREAAARQLQDVEFVGFVEDAELPRYYRTATVFCAPSTGFEALGIVLLEAMASGTPVVTTRIEGYRTVVRDGVEGVLVPPRDASALAAALTGLLRDSARRAQLVAAGRARVSEYAWPTIAQRLLDVYEDHRGEIPGHI